MQNSEYSELNCQLHIVIRVDQPVRLKTGRIGAVVLHTCYIVNCIYVCMCMINLNIYVIYIVLVLYIFIIICRNYHTYMIVYISMLIIAVYTCISACVID